MFKNQEFFTIDVVLEESMEAGSACPVVLLCSTQSCQAPGDRFVRESVMEQPFPTT